MSHILIASLGESPIVVSSMYDLLVTQQHIQLDRVRVLCPQVDKIDTSYLLVEEALLRPPSAAQKAHLAVEQITLDFDDANYQQTLEKAIDRAQGEKAREGEVLLALSGGRKGMTAQTIFATQNEEINYVYHTLIRDEELSERINEETTIKMLQDTPQQALLRSFYSQFKPKIDPVFAPSRKHWLLAALQAILDP